jgi:carboxymethylenebutenolidase
VLHEWWGVNQVIVDHAVKISQHGYRCLIPDLYKARTPPRVPLLACSTNHPHLGMPRLLLGRPCFKAYWEPVLVPVQGKVGVDKEEATHLMNNLDWQQAVQEIKQAVDYLRGDGANKASARLAGAAHAVTW